MSKKLLPLFWNHSLTLLLLLLFCLQGAKNPISFFVWGSAALTVCAYHQWAHPGFLNLKDHGMEWALFAWICCAQFFSKDPSVSFFRTTQAIVFLLFWLCLKTSPN